MKAAKALKEKGDTPEALLRSIKENEAAVAEAQRVVDAWKAIAGERKRRAEEAERVVQEKAEEEARVEAEKKAEAERKAEEEQRAVEEKRIAEEKAEAERKAQEERERAEVEERDRIEAELDAQKAEEEARLEAERKAEEEAVEKDAELKEDKKKPQLKDVVKAIYEKGKSAASRLYKMAFFDVAKTPDFMKKLGLTGDRFTIKYGVLSRHAGKDDSHSLTEKLWEELPDALQKPFAITRFGGKDKGYRLYTTMKNENGETIVVGVDVKNVGRDMEVNAISTIFGRRGDAKKTQKEDVLYTAENITPEQRSLLGQPNSDQYTGVRERNVSTDKGSEKPEKKQEKQSVFDKAKEIADKEEKKRKAEAEDDSVLGQATRAVGKKKKINLFKYTVSEKNSHPALRGVHYANGYAYASDGYILFKEKADYPKEWEGSTRDKDGNLIDGKYPDTEKAIHRLVHIPDKEVESLPSKEVLDFAITASKKLKGEAIPVAIDGIFFNAVNLKKFLEAVASKGIDKVVYRHPMLYATNGKDEIVMMPTVNTLEGALDIADRMESVGLPKEQIDAWKAHIEAADKKMSFDDFKKAVENAKKEGARHTEAEKPKEQPLTEAERKDAEEVAGALGYRVEWVDTMAENGTIDADKKVIRIAKDAENPLVQVLGHEVAHGVKRMDGGKFKALQKAAMEVVGEKEWNERIEKKRKLNAYAEGKLAEEVTCDIVGEALNDKDALKRLAESLRGERGILARLRDAVVRMVEYFKNRGDKDGVRRMKAADKLLAEFEGALKEGVAPGQANTEDVDRSVRESRSEKTELTAEERELRDNLVERMRKGGLDVVTDSEEMQRVIDTENERTRMMGAGSVREHRVYHGSGADFDAFDHSHMGEGEGAHAYGWGTYVTEVEGIGRTYANATAHNYNNALRPLERKIDSILTSLRINGSELDKARAGLRNAVRFKTKENYEEFLKRREEIEEKYGKHSTQYDDYLWNSPYAIAVRAIEHYENKIKERETKLHSLQKDLEETKKQIENIAKEFPRHLYTVEIPDDNGSNYLDWNGHPAESLLKDVGSFLESNGFERVQDNPARYEKGESTVVLNPNATGADLYAELREALGSDKKASQALAELGCIGIKYPADNMRGGREDGAKNYVIFNENDAKITDHTRFLRTADGEVYGLVKDGRIYLDPKVATSETAVHEYTHLWGDMLRRKDSEQWSRTVKELKNSVLWEEVKELYPELKTDDEIADEVLSTFSGRRGAERLREEARRVAEGEGGVFTNAKAIETLERVKEAIARFWEGVARMFGINRYRSAEELADMAMRDLINGVKPTSRTFTFDNFYKDTKAVFEGTERPKGKPDYTSYSGSEYWYGEDKGGKYVVRGSDHWSGEFKVKDGERTNVGRNHYSEITEDGMLPIGAQGSLKFGWEKGLSKPVGSGISAAIDRRGSGDSNNIASCYWYIDNAKEKDNKGFTYGKAYLSEFEDKERRRDIPGDDWRDIQGLEGGTRAMAERIAEQPVEEINNRFNEELEKYQNNELPKGHRFELGMPSAELQSAGFPTLPISMRSSLLAKKAGAERHPFAPTDLRDLVNAIQKPIAIFNYSKNNMRNLIVDVSRGGKHFLVGVTLNYKADNIEINSVSGLFPKENHEWIKWIQDGKVLRIDQKEKVQDLINSLRTNPAESERIGLNLDDVAKKVKDFENPKLFDGKISEVDKKGSDSIDRSVRENPKNEDKPRYSRKPGESIFDYASRVSEAMELYRDGELERVNEEFNNRLSSLAANRNQKDRVLKLGRPSRFLIDGGVTDAEIILEFDKLARKSDEGYKNEHPFDVMDVENLPLAIAYPIAVFDNTNGYSSGKVILTELEKDGRNFIVVVQTISQRRKGGVVLEVNRIDTLFPKEERGIVNWFNKGLASNIDKEKALRFIKALPNHPGTITKEELLSATKEVKNFENSKSSDVGRLVGALKDKTDFELYNRLAGEVEARNTEKRIGMTEEERRASLASETEDVAREDQILLRQGLDGIDIMRSEAAATPLKGDEALTALDSIFGENEGSAIPPKISSFAKFKNLFKKPVRTFLGELVQVKDEVWNKILRNNRQDITGTVLPTIENADFAIRDTDGSTLYVKRFKGDGQERMYNVVVVNKHGEVEDYISSVHIKRDNNLRNKIKKGAELFLPNARTTDGTMSRNNSTPGAKVANYSETAKPRFSRKPGESIFDYASRVSEDVDRSVRERVSARDEYEKKVKSKGFQTKEALQNSMLGLQEFMYAIDHASGNKRYIEDIPDFENPILGENRLSSVNKEESHSRLDAVHSPTPTKGVRKPYLRSYTMIYMPIPSNVSGS